MLLITVLTLLLTEVRGDDCSPPPSRPHFHPWACCPLRNISSTSFGNMTQASSTCSKKLDPPRVKYLNSTEVKRFINCAIQCVFSESGLLSADGRLDEEAIRSVFVLDDEELVRVMGPAVEECLEARQEDDVQGQGSCGSAAGQFYSCVTSLMFVRCPRDRWKSSDQCTDQLKARVSKCPQLLYY